MHSASRKQHFRKIWHIVEDDDDHDENYDDGDDDDDDFSYIQFH